MLGRKTYTPDELTAARSMIDQQLRAFRALDPDDPAVAALEPVFFNNALLALDRLFVHRVRAAAGKDGTPVNEVEVLCDSLLNNGGILRPINVIRYRPEDAVLGLAVGDRIALSATDVEKLAEAFLVELEQKFS